MGAPKKRSLTHKAYVEIGQVEGALSRHADQVYASLLPQEQQQAHRIFVQLVNPGRGTEDTRRLSTRRELGQNWDLIAKLANERLVVTSSVMAGPKQVDADEAVQQDTVEVVHEALIRNWGQLRRWLDADREFLTWKLGLRADLTRWEEAKRDDGSLLRSVSLAVAQEKLQERREDLSEQERAYIEVSLVAQTRQERKRRLIFAGAMLASVVIMGLLGLGFWLQSQNAREQAQLRQAAVDQQAEAEQAKQQAEAAQREAQYQARIAQARQLAADSRAVHNLRGDSADLPLLLAHEAVLTAWRVDDTIINETSSINKVDIITQPVMDAAGTALFEAVNLSHFRSTLPPRHHSGPVTAVAFSPNGERIVTGSEDYTAKVWLVDIDKLLELAQQRIQRQVPVLTPQERQRYGIEK